MKKILISSLFAILIATQSVFAVSEQDMLTDNTTSTTEFKKYVFDILKEQQKINDKEIDLNLDFKKDLNNQNEIIRQHNDLIETYKYKIKSLESTIDKQQSTINKLDSRLYTIEKKIK
jgi:peptidoglycan hydrolase CwlO-like protein